MRNRGQPPCKRQSLALPGIDCLRSSLRVEKNDIPGIFIQVIEPFRVARIVSFSKQALNIGFSITWPDQMYPFYQNFGWP